MRPTRRALARSIETKAREMSELVSNVLDLMRFECGQIVLRRDWQTLDDLHRYGAAAPGSAAGGLYRGAALPADLPPVYVDAALIMQVFTNLLDNIAKYTPAGTRGALSSSGGTTEQFVRVYVDDEGPGLPRAIRRACSRSSSAAAGRARLSAWAWVLPSAARSSARTAGRSRRSSAPAAAPGSN